MAGFEILAAILTVLAAVLFSLSIIAYSRERAWRLLVAIVVFALFLVKGMIITISIFTTSLEEISNSVDFHLWFDVIIIIFLFFTVIREPKDREKEDSASGNTEEGNTKKS